MISRRLFIVTSLGLLIVPDIQSVQAKKVKPKIEIHLGGPRTIVRQEWPPAISPEYVGIVDRSYACFADDMGRLAIVDFKQEDTPIVLGELFGIGRKIVALAITQHRAFAIAQVEVGGDTQYQLVVISLTPAADITVMSRIPLENFSEPSALAASGELIAVAGLGLNGESQIVIYGAGKKKSIDPVQLSAIVLERLPVKLDMQEHQLLALCGADNTALTLISLMNPRAPQQVKTLSLAGNYQLMARNHDLVVVAGSSRNKNQAKIISLKSGLTVKQELPLPAVSELLDLAAQKGQFLILCNQGSRQAVVPLAPGKKGELVPQNAVLLPAGTQAVASRARIAVSERDSYIASDWGGVQVLNVQRNGWQFMYSHTIPRLPASALVVDGDKALLACADLKLYNLKDLKHPVLESSTDIVGNIRGIASVGGSVICLSRDTLNLRSIRRPAEILASIKTKGSFISYDQSTGRAYVLQQEEAATTVTTYKVTEESLRQDSVNSFPLLARRAVAAGGRLLLVGLSEVMLLDMADSNKQIAFRKMPNRAIRDAAMIGDSVYLSCVDENLRGYFTILSGADQDFPIVGSIELSMDAAALSVSGNTAVVLGRSKEGKDTATILELSNPIQPKITDSFPVLDAASAVSIQDKTAIIAGRGLEIISLS